jgi:type VI secretion system protein ImpB
MSESTQHKLDRVRPPRVQITYDVEIGNAIEMRELPFVMGIMADLSGDRDPDRSMKLLKERKFVEIDRDNFNDLMAEIAPRVSIRVDNKLGGGQDAENTQLSVLLNFRNIEDFEPVQIIKQVEPMRKLYEARTRLNDLLAKLDGNDSLDALLRNVLEHTEVRDELKKNLGDADAASAAADAKPAAPAKPATAAKPK